MTQCFGLFDTTACLLLLLWNDTLLLGQASAQAFLMAHTSSLQLFLLMQKKKKNVATTNRAIQKSLKCDGSEHRNFLFRTNTAEHSM